jgi:hypothetical protein
MTITASQREDTDTTGEKQFALMVRVGACERHTVAVAKRFAESDVYNTGRRIRLSECPILRTDLKGDGYSRGDEIEIWIYELEGDQIGSFDSLTYIQLSLPPAAFAEFWTGCAAADGAARNISIHFKSDATNYFKVTRVDLVEYMAAAIDYNPKGHALGYLPGRPHPVVAEFRDIRHRFIGSWKGFLIFICFILGISLITEILRAAWRFIQP